MAKIKRRGRNLFSVIQIYLIVQLTRKNKRSLYDDINAEELYGEILLSAKVPRKDGKGYEYPVKGSLMYLYESVAGNAHQAWEYYAGL